MRIDMIDQYQRPTFKKDEVRIPSGDGISNLSARNRSTSLILIVVGVIALFIVAWFVVKLIGGDLSKGGIGAPETPSVIR